MSIEITQNDIELLEYAFQLAYAEIHNQIVTCPDVDEYAEDITEFKEAQKELEETLKKIKEIINENCNVSA